MPPETPAPESPQESPELDLATELATLMQNDPQAAERIMALLEGGSPVTDLPAPVPAAPPVTQVPPVPAAPAPQMDPALMQRMAMMEQRLQANDEVMGDYKLNQQLGDLRGKHGQMLQHFGGTVPEDFSALEPAVLQEYKAIMEGTAPIHELAYQRALLNQALQGEGTLQDRILAAAAKNAPPVTPEGKGGGIPSTQPEAPKTYATTADRMAALKNLFRSMDQAQPGS